VSYTVDVDEATRRAIVHYYGDDNPRLATRDEVRRWYVLHGETLDDDLRSEHGVCCYYDGGAIQ